MEGEAGALDTGVPASIIAQMIAKAEIAAGGVSAPETVVAALPFFVELSKREIRVYVTCREALFPLYQDSA